MLSLAQGVKGVQVHKLRELVEFSVVVDAQRGAVCRELNQGVEVLPLSELLLCLIVQECVELSPDVAPGDALRVLVIGTHGGHLSPHPDGASMFCKTLLDARMALEQDEVSKRYLPNLCRHAKITLQNLTLLYSQLLVKIHF